MKSIPNILSTILILLLCSGCEDDIVPKNELVIGKWNLISYEAISNNNFFSNGGPYPTNSYFDLKNGGEATLKIYDNIYSSTYSISEIGDDMKLFIDDPKKPPNINEFNIYFPTSGFEVKELTSKRMVLYTEFSPLPSVTVNQTLLLEK